MGTQEHKVYSYNHVHTCMCIIEEMVEPNLAGEPWKDYRDQWGVNGLRDVVIEKLAHACNTAWLDAYARYEQEDSDWRELKRLHAPVKIEAYRTWEKANPQPKDPGSFDYEFVPFWLRTCVDWSGAHPRVRGAKS